MKSKAVLPLIGLLILPFFFPFILHCSEEAKSAFYPVIDYETLKEEYTVKQGDQFFVQIMGLEVKEIVAPVSISGHIVLYPLAKPVLIGGLTLSEAETRIYNALRSIFMEAEIKILLADISPQPIHIIGAVNSPGLHMADSLLTLQHALFLADGLSPAASRKIALRRRGKEKVYDLNRYLLDGDKSQNPLIFGNDLIIVDFASEFAKVYVVTDSVNYVEYFELDNPRPAVDLLKGLSQKHYLSDYSQLRLRRNNVSKRVNSDFLVHNGDELYLQPEMSYVFVRGNINSPGRFSYLSGRTPQYYISAAGGVNRVGSSKTIYIVDFEGNRVKYRGQEIHEGDTIIIPLSIRTVVTDYLTPVSTILSLVTTIVVLTR